MTHNTRKEWEQFNPYFGGSMRSHQAARLSQAKDDILELYAEIDRIAAKPADEIDLGPQSTAFHTALRKYPDSFEALHYFWNEAFASTPPSSNGAEGLGDAPSNIDSAPAARIDYRKFMAWVGLNGPRPSNAELAFYLELGNREEVDAVEAAVLLEAIEVLKATPPKPAPPDAMREALVALLPDPLKWKEDGDGVLTITVRKADLRNARVALSADGAGETYTEVCRNKMCPRGGAHVEVAISPATGAAEPDDQDPPMKWLIEALRGLATELIADPKTPWIGERDPKQHICWTAADRLAAAATFPVQPGAGERTPEQEEISKCWQRLEESGFPPEASGWPFKSIVGALPDAIDAALDCLIRQREDLLKEVQQLRQPQPSSEVLTAAQAEAINRRST